MITKEYIVFLDRATLLADLRIPDFNHAWVNHEIRDLHGSPRVPIYDIGAGVSRLAHTFDKVLASADQN